MTARPTLALFAGLFAATAAQPARAHEADDPLTRAIAPDFAQRWLAPLPAARLHGDTYFVGFGGLGVALVRTRDGLVLVDGAVPQAVQAVEANIRELGFRVEDVRYILSTEPHWDHAGGIAALARDSGATVVASANAARALRAGKVGRDDPQYGDLAAFPPVTRLRTIADGETLQLGGTTFTARATPGHTAGSLSWSWRSCAEDRCLDVVFGASLNAVSAEGYRFSDGPGLAVTAALRRSFERMRALPCDLLITSHPDQSGFDDRYRRFVAGEQPNPLFDAGACRAHADRAEQRLDARLARESKADP